MNLFMDESGKKSCVTLPKLMIDTTNRATMPPIVSQRKRIESSKSDLNLANIPPAYGSASPVVSFAFGNIAIHCNGVSVIDTTQLTINEIPTTVNSVRQYSPASSIEA